MIENGNEVVGLLHKKAEIVNELLRVTEIVELTGDESRTEKEASDYFFLIEKREKMIDQLLTLQKEIDNFDYGENLSANKIVSDTNESLSKILALDTNNNKTMKLVYEKIKTSIKGINISKNVNARYQSGYSVNEGKMYDKKQ